MVYLPDVNKENTKGKTFEKAKQWRAENKMAFLESLATSIISSRIIKGVDKINELTRDKRSDFEKRLAKLINETIAEYSENHPIVRGNTKEFAFYDSEVIIE